jgi:hypothetical protein
VESLRGLFRSIQVSQASGKPRLNKPLLLLAALARCSRSEARLATIDEYERELQSVFEAIGSANMLFPFGRLCSDGLWEIPEFATLRKNSSGDLLRSELIERQIVGGFRSSVFDALSASDKFLSEVCQLLLEEYFPSAERSTVLGRLKFGAAVNIAAATPVAYLLAGDPKQLGEEMGEQSQVYGERRSQNDFVGYLNTLHSLGADGSNALAESQAMSDYFAELYEPFDIVQELKQRLTDGEERIVILTGHAGDGKSTVALDVFKALKGLPAAQPLAAPLREREDVPTDSGPVTIVKDMSELSGDQRRAWLRQAFTEAGSWLIISNTGPLLNSLIDYAKDQSSTDMESRILEALDAPIRDNALDEAGLTDFEKPLQILNLTRLDNVALGARLLAKLVRHSGWQGCEGCDIQTACPLALNRRALLEHLDSTEERVRWLYRRINDYEQRLTLRQILAHLAYGVTGGMGCAQARAAVDKATGSGRERGTSGLRSILFSEGFFGCRDGRPDPQADAFKAIQLLRRADLGGPVAVDVERSFVDDPGGGWAELPQALDHIAAHWSRRAKEPQGWPARAALRRQALIFGRSTPERSAKTRAFFDGMLRSPALRDLESWRQNRLKALTRSEQKQLRVGCLNVLLEVFSGFSGQQFEGATDQLFFTMRRPDRATLQVSQLVTGSVPFKEFEILLDSSGGTAVLRHRPTAVTLELNLPLLDYIYRRGEGELGNTLAPIHETLLDRFQAELLGSIGGNVQEDEIAFLKAGVSGDVEAARYFFDENTGRLEKDQ